MPLHRDPSPQRLRSKTIAASAVGREPEGMSAPQPRAKRLRRHLAAATALAGLTALALTGTALAGTIGYSGKIVPYTVGTTGTYEITATGANGGAGGQGVRVGGNFNLTGGQSLEILVGGGGYAGTSLLGGGGGGGGSFVVLASGTPLVVAGGGGGASGAGVTGFGIDGLPLTYGGGLGLVRK